MYYNFVMGDAADPGGNLTGISYSKLNFYANPNFYINFNAFSYILVNTLYFPKENIGKLHTQSRINRIKLSDSIFLNFTTRI